MSSFDRPTVSVVVATQDRPELLGSALASIWHQDYQGEIECIVVYDGHLPDQSLTRDEPGRRIRVVENERSPGLAGARNTGILISEGQYVAFCDDDDEWFPAKISEQMRLLDAGAAIATTGIRITYDGHETDRVPTPSSLSLDHLVRTRAMEAHPSTIIVERTALTEKIGLVDEEIPGSYGEDFDWIIRAVRLFPVSVVERPLVRVRWGGSKFSQKWRTIVEAIDYMIAKHPEFSDDRVALARLLGRRSFALAALRQRRQALACAGRAFRASPAERRTYLAVAVCAGLVSAERLMAVAHRRGHGI